MHELNFFNNFCLSFNCICIFSSFSSFCTFFNIILSNDVSVSCPIFLFCVFSFLIFESVFEKRLIKLCEEEFSDSSSSLSFSFILFYVINFIYYIY